MKNKRVIEIVLKRIWQNKKRNMIIVVPIILMVVILMIINLIQTSFTEYEKMLEANIEMRTILVSYDKDEYEEISKKIQEIEHIDMVLDEYESWIQASQKCKEFGETIELSTQAIDSKNCVEVIAGRKIEDNDRNVIILPNKIYENTLGGYSTQHLETNYIKGEDYLGKTIKIEFTGAEGTVIQNFEVIGIYDVEKYYSIAEYIPKEIAGEISRKTNLNTKRVHVFDVIVDKIENLEEVKSQLIEKGIMKRTTIEIEAGANTSKESNEAEGNFVSVSGISFETLDTIQKLNLFLAITSFVILAILLIVTNVNQNYLALEELGVQKVEGYTNKDVQKITILENIIVTIISIIIGLIIFKIIQMLGNKIICSIVQKETVDIIMKQIQEQLANIMLMPQKTNKIYTIGIAVAILIVELANTFITNTRILSKEISELIKR